MLYSVNYSFGCDIWSLGIMHYQMLIGEAPFDASDMASFKKIVRKGTYYYPKDCIPSIETILLISRCLVESEAQRFSYESLLELTRAVL